MRTPFRIPVRSLQAALILPLAFGITACGDSPPPSATESPAAFRGGHAHGSRGTGDIGPEQLRELAALRAYTAPFHRIEAAAAAGWGTAITNCMTDPALGGMGFHYGNTALIDGSVDVLEPELLLYEPRKNGELRLVAVEYIVPYTAWSSATPPSLLGQSFARNDTFGLWVLHVWHFRHNPRGIFQDWNPDVTCAFAS